MADINQLSQIPRHCLEYLAIVFEYTSPSSSNISPLSSNTSPPFSNTSPPSSNTARYLTAILEYPGAVFEYLAVVLEYLSTGLSELPGNAPRNIKKHPVVPRPFQLAIRNDDEEFGNLRYLFSYHCPLSSSPRD
ncbi:hypothetical protein B0H13DRAFT_2129612 [Mycena leptocephala]|nr:hypothetical protein B0H13DRAFT_2129612 [Mycena leptocephala]